MKDLNFAELTEDETQDVDTDAGVGEPHAAFHSDQPQVLPL